MVLPVGLLSLVDTRNWVKGSNATHFNERMLALLFTKDGAMSLAHLLHESDDQRIFLCVVAEHQLVKTIVILLVGVTVVFRSR